MALNGNLRIDGARLWASLMDMAEIGPGVAGGNNRQTLTDADREGRDLFASWCAQAGMSLAIDSMGSMFARREGTDPSLPPVMAGSHLDTQPTGGRFDGVLGVLGALEVVRALNDAGIRTRHPIEIVNWTNEEGARFSPAMVASGVFAGAIEEAVALARTDLEGATLGAELERIGYKGEVPCAARPIKAFFELHIEQGPILEAEGVDIGVVTHAQGLRWIDIELTGYESHTGTTPMARRRDALLGAARVVDAVDRIGRAYAPNAVASVGRLVVHPNSRNIIPGRVSFCVDIRNPDLRLLRDMEAEVGEAVAAVAAGVGLEVKTEPAGSYDPVTFDAACVKAVRDAAVRLGFSHRDMVSGAGHDACYVARVAPTAMIFCPCVGGISHNEAEEISPEWAAAGANVLFHAVVETAGIVED